MSFSIKHLFRDTLLYSSGQIVPRLTAFFLFPLFARFLTAEDYGVLGQIGTLNLVATSIVNLGFNMSLPNAYVETSDKKKQRGLIWSSFLLLLLFNALLLAAVSLFASPLSSLLLGNSSYNRCIVLGFASVSFSGLIVSFASYLKIERKALTLVLLTVFEVLAASFLSLYFVISEKLGAEGPLLGQLIAQGILFLLFIIIVALKAPPALFFKKSLWSTFFLGLPYIGGFFGTFLMQSGTRFVLVEMRGLEEGGIYYVSQMCAKVLELFIMGMMTAWLPLYAKIASDQEKSLASLKETISTFTLIISIPVSASFLFAKPLLSFLVPYPLSSGWNIVGPLALSQAIFGIYALIQPIFVFQKRTLLQLLVEGTSGLFGLLLALILTPNFGKEGAAIAQLLACTSLTLLSLFTIRRFYPITLETSRLKKILGAFTLVALPSYFSLSLLESILLWTLFLLFVFKKTPKPLQEAL